MQLSVVIPTLNEETNITELLNLLKDELGDVQHEVIVVDADSDDKTTEFAEKLGAKVLILKERSRAKQMNFGADVSKGDILYFVHADSRPPKDFFNHMLNAIADGYDIGCFRFKFDSSKLMLKLNSYFTRFDREMCRGGDQTLFIKRSDFKRLGGYDEGMKIMEDYAFMRKARKELKFKIIPKDVIVSARKYEENSYFRVNLANLSIFILYGLGCSQDCMVKAYKKMISHPKAEGLE